MKRFSCGDVVPGCDASFEASAEDELLAQIATHAAEIHGLTSVPDELIAQVRSKIHSVA